MARTAAIFLVLFLLPLPASAQQRVALVLGNAAYQHTTALGNPKNDAVDVAAVLKKHGQIRIELSSSRLTLTPGD